MGKPAARIGDMHTCPMVTPGMPPIPHVGGPVTGPGVPTVLIGGMPAAVMGDMCVCVGPPANIIMGSVGVFIGGKPAARMGDPTAHGGVIVMGCPTVLIGEVSPGTPPPPVLPLPMKLAMAQMGAAGTTAAQLLTLKNAAKKGVPFCEKCAAAAAAKAIKNDLVEPKNPVVKLAQSKNSKEANKGSAQEISDTGLEFIKKHESFRSKVYKDVAGLPTIGIGHLIKKGETFSTITEKEALQLLKNDASIAVNAVKKLVTVPLTQNQFDALVSITFNIGAPAFSKSTLLRTVNQGDSSSIEKSFKMWNKATIKGVLTPIDGLTIRRQSEANLFINGNY